MACDYRLFDPCNRIFIWDALKDGLVDFVSSICNIYIDTRRVRHFLKVGIAGPIDGCVSYAWHEVDPLNMRFPATPPMLANFASFHKGRVLLLGVLALSLTI